MSHAFGKTTLLLLALAAFAAKGCDDGAETDNGPDCSSMISAKTDVPCEGDVVEFADVYLESAVRSAINKPDGDLLVADVAGLESLDALILDIVSLDGIQCLSSLVWLNLEQNAISDLMPLSNLSSLTVLRLGNNQVGDLTPLAGLPSLEELYVEVNQVSDLSPIPCIPSLKLANLDANQIDDLEPLGYASTLTDLSLAGNQIGSIAPLENLTSLSSLILENNEVTDLSALAANYGIGEGDHVRVDGNPIDASEQAANISELCSRGVLLDPYCGEDFSED